EAQTIESRDESVSGSLHTLFRWLRIGTLMLTLVLLLGIFANVQVTWILAAIGVVATAGSIVCGDLIYNAVSRVILKSERLVTEGDWLEVTGLGVNGEVKSVGNALIVVQNWDNTLATVPPRYLMSNSFRNWQQMHLTGRRRILRTLHLEVTSVRPLDAELLASIRARVSLAALLDSSDEPKAEPVQFESLTNAALYRLYLMRHLEAHPLVAKDSTRRVTNEDSLGNGLPVLILAYATVTQDIPFRMLEAELYEYAVAAAPLFGLAVYQGRVANDLSTPSPWAVR
ncbi:MAG: mechanosensitive ion channel domain-containing protein, partial [Caldilineaceae bacterium]